MQRIVLMTFRLARIFPSRRTPSASVIRTASNAEDHGSANRFAHSLRVWLPLACPPLGGRTLGPGQTAPGVTRRCVHALTTGADWTQIELKPRRVLLCLSLDRIASACNGEATRDGLQDWGHSDQTNGGRRGRIPAHTHIRAAGTATRARTRLNAISTHPTFPTSAPKSRKTSGNASVTTPESPSTTATTSDNAGTAPVRPAGRLVGWCDPRSSERTLPHPHRDPGPIPILRDKRDSRGRSRPRVALASSRRTATRLRSPAVLGVTASSP